VFAACVVALCGCASDPSTRSETAAAAASEPDEVVAALMAAEFAWQDGRRESAARHHARAASLSSDPEVAQRAAQVALIARDPALARQGLARWREIEPEAPAQSQIEAGIAFLDGNIEDAIAALDRLLASETDDERTMAGQALLGAPERSDALAVIEAYRARTAVAGGVETHILFGQVALQLQAADLAAAWADHAVARFPESPGGLAFRAQLATVRGDTLAAEADFARALSISPSDRTLRLTYASALNRLGLAASAARTLSEIAPDDEVLAAQAAYAVAAEDPALIAANYEALVGLPTPRPAARLLLLGQMAELAMRPEEALGWYQQVPEGPEFVSARFRTAIVHEIAGRMDQARGVLAELRAGGIADDEQLAESWLLEAEILARAGLDKDAERAYRSGLMDLPENPRLLYALGLSLAQGDSIDEALDTFQRLVEVDPENADALNALGYTMTDRTDRHAEALGYIERALALKPDSAAIIDSMGWVLHRKGRSNEALPHLQRAFELEPNAEIGAHLGEVLWVLGRQSDAREIWKQARLLDAENAVLKETILRLDQPR
jgi:tetratricopeptide (TPR) repeat protein